MLPKTILSKRQQRFLAKIGLMPLTHAEEISQRTGIPKNVLWLHSGPDPRNYSTKLALIDRFGRKPETHYLLEHPKLWQIARIRDLAKNHSGTEIHKILLHEAQFHAKPNAPLQICSASAITRIMRDSGLRSADDISAMHARIQAGRRKPSNNLSNIQRKKLLAEAQSFINKMRFRSTKIMTADELRSAIMERLEKEVQLFDPRGMQGPKLVNQWIKFIKVRVKFFIQDILRARGPYTRDRKPRRPLSNSDLAQNTTRTIPETREIKFKAPLTSRQQQAWELLCKGLTIKQIARELRINMSSVIRLKRIISEKIVWSD